ncbi:MAG: cadherin-like domain-containing protein [Sulfuricurvum sp.]|jgi:hypothetical protein
MAQVLGNVKSFEAGTFFVKENNGQIRQLKNGDLIYEGDNVYGVPGNSPAAKILIDVILPGMGDVVLAGNGALTFDTSVLTGIFSHHDAVVYIDSVQDALASAEPKDAANTDVTDAGETAAGSSVSDTERMGDIFAARTGLVGDVSTSLRSAENTSLLGVQVSADNPVILDTATPTAQVNNPPAANNDNSTEAVNDILTTQEDTALSISADTLLANDVDLDGDTIIITGVQGAVNGIVTLEDGNIVFTPSPDYNGPASFDYTISDGHGGTDTATVYLNVLPVNDAPIAQWGDIETNEDTPITFIPGGSDVEGDEIAYSVTSDPEHGDLQENDDGTYTYLPNENYSGSDSFEYTVSDAQGGSNTYQVNITVNPISDAPSLEVSLDLSDENLALVYSDKTNYNLHTNNSTTGVIELGEDATSALISLKSYKVDVDDGTIILLRDGEPVASISIDEAYADLHNEDTILSVDAGGLLFDSIMVNNYVTGEDINSEFKIKSINASVASYEYTLNINDAYLTDDDGSELLGDSVSVKGLPAWTVLTNSDDSSIVTADENGVALLDPEPASWTMTFNHELPSDTSIVTTLTSTDGDTVSAITSVGVYGDNEIVGGDGNDILIGGDGNDVLMSDLHTIGDTVYGDTQAGAIDGGDGTDTLVLTSGSNIDFGVLESDNNPIMGVEVIDLSQNGDHQLQNISHQDVVDMTGGGNILTILGDSATETVSVDLNTMQYDGTSIETINGVDYNFDIYSSISTIDPTVTLRVESIITDVIV